MAKGRRDYTWGVLQDSIQPGLYSVDFIKVDQVYLGSIETGSALSYTVPEGYKLFLLGVYVTTGSFAVNHCRVKRNDAYLSFLEFEVNHELNFGTYGSVSYEPGKILTVEVTNKDDRSFWFYCTVLGVLEELV